MTGHFLRHVCLHCWLVLLTIAGTSGVCAAPLTLRFEQFGVEQGLSQETVTSILQDRDGYMWFGTQAGLNRFDGYRVTAYKNDLANAGSLLDNYVQALYEDTDGQLWVGTKGGLDRYLPASQSFAHYPIPGGTRSILSIIGDGARGLWLASSDGLLHVDPASGTFTALRHDPTRATSIADDRINTLVRDQRGNLWIGSASGIELLAAGSKEFQHFPLEVVQALSVGPDNVLWIGTLTGLQAWRIGTTKPQAISLSQEDALAGQRITSVYHDKDGVLWVGTFADGLRRRDPDSGHFHAYRANPLDRHGISESRINTLYQDRTGTLWIGNWYAGADRVDLASGGFERYTEIGGVLPGIGNNKVRALASAGRDQVWLGTGDGLVRLDVKQSKVEIWRHDPRQAGSPLSGQITAFATDRRQRLWVGWQTGLGRRDPVTGVVTPVPLGTDPLSNYVQRMMLDREGVLWVASRTGLHRIDPDTLVIQHFMYGSPGGLNDARVYAMLEDRRGNLWLGSESGLEKFDRATGKVRLYQHDPRRPDSLGQNRIHYLMEDSKGRIWIGTSGGLCVAQLGADGEPRFRFVAPGAGRTPDPIGAILEDEVGNLWISSTAGIARFDPSSGLLRHYTSKDGLIEGSYFIGSGYKAPDGSLYFGGLAGMTAFLPARISDNPYPPQVSITDFSIFNQSILSGTPRTDVLTQGPIHAAKTLALSYLDSVFTFEFAALHHADPQRNRYAYRLEGFDAGWVQADASKRFATYTNLDPGNYVFRVRASNKDGVWSPDAIALAVTIAPPLWKTWWFRLLAALIVLGTAYLLFRIRIRMLVQQKHALELQVSARTHELLLQKESVERQKREVEHQKESVELAHRNISLLSDIGRQITANLDSEAIMAMLYRQVNELMDASVFGIGIYRPEAELIEYPFAMERDKRYTPYTRSMHEPNQLAVWCIVHAQEVFINDLNLEYRRYIDDLSMVSGAEDMGTLEDGSLPTEPRSLIYVPISLGGRVRGVITVHSYREHAYQRIDLDMLNTLASYVAVAFDNADAYRQLQDTQQQLVAREKLAALGALVAGVAHELNTPIGNSLVIASTLEDKTVEIAAKSAGETMRRSDLKAFIEAATEASALLMRSLRSAAELVNSFKQVAVDQASAKRRQFNLLQASHEIAATIMNRIRKSGHRLELEMPDDIVMDSFPGPYGQVIINLINNSLLHAFEGKDGGIMRISAVRMGTDRVRILFQDDGAGIPRDHLDRIFDPFFTTKLGQGGNGLGLSITYNIVTSLLDGQIRVDSAPGVGTVFTMDLPLVASLAGE